MLQPNKLDKVVGHFKGQLVQGQPRQVVVQKNIDELRENKVPLFAAWSVRFEVPLDMACDCEKAMGWITNRLLKYKEAGYKLIEISAELRQTKKDPEGREEPKWEPYWSGMFVHPEGKDPRKTIEKCVHYQQVLT